MPIVIPAKSLTASAIFSEAVLGSGVCRENNSS